MMAPNIDPVLIALGPIQVRWYGLMYVVGFLIGSFLLKVLIKEGFLKIPKDKVDNLITQTLIFMFIGSRAAYVFIYNWDYYSQNLMELLSVWKGGLSFHGAVVGMAVGIYFFAKKQKVPMLQVTDAAVIVGAQGVFFGRMGNFINHELWGRVTDVPWGMVFVDAGPFPRHPSQLYEAILEGVVLFLILWLARKKFKTYGVATAMFFGIYAIFRFIVEFYREADAQLGYYFGSLTMGHILCFLQLLFSIGIYLYVRKNAQRLVVIRN